MRSLCRITFSLTSLLILGSIPAFAQEDPCVSAIQAFVAENDGLGAGNLFALLNGQREIGCILGPTDRSGIENRYQVLFDPDSSDNQKAAARAELFDLTIDEFAEWPRRDCDDADDLTCIVGRHVDAINALQTDLVQETTEPNARLVDQNSWQVSPADGSIDISRANLNNLLTNSCAESLTDGNCRDGIKLSGSLMRSSIAMNQVITEYRLPTIEAGEEFLSTRDKEWNAYFNDVSVQWPWELGVNSWLYTKKNRGSLDGFPRAPNERWKILHPSLGFEHIDTPSDASSTSAAVFVEVVGFERWQWRDGEAANRWGLSIVASLANIPNMDSVGYGAFLHTPIRNISVGAIWRDGDAGSETGIIANVNLAAMLQEYGNLDLRKFLTPQAVSSSE